VIGETPQPGEKPSHEGNPWSFSDPGAGWWRGETDRGATEPPTGRRHPRRRAPAAPNPAAAAPQGGTGTLLPPSEAGPMRVGEEADAHAAGVLDAQQQMAPEAPARPEMVERDHDRPDQHRYDPLRPPAGYTSRAAALDEPPVEDEAAPEPEQDVMVLPEPNDRNRPTVPLEKTPGPVRQNRRVRPSERLTEPLPRATGDPVTDARLDRLENSPFWHTDPEVQPHSHAQPEVEERSAYAAGRRGRHPAHRPPIAAMSSLIALGLLAAFFAWVSAEPFWLAMGHGDTGTATVTTCTSSGVTQHCVGQFAAGDGSFTIARVTLLGVGPGHRVPGTTSLARMVSPDSPRAYLGDTTPLLQVRWLLGFILVLFCGYVIAGVTGARRLPSARARRGAILASLGGPLLLLAGFLIGAY
jgi:hypothetical protein